MTEDRQTGISARGILFAYLFMPVMVGVAWWKALRFDPYTMSFATKTYFEPTAGMPGEYALGGAVFVAIGAALMAIFAYGVRAGRTSLREAGIGLWCGFLVVAFGCSFFLVAHRTAAAIAERAITP